jgi:uncharacterized protein YndB with AHSA1/START domain
MPDAAISTTADAVIGEVEIAASPEKIFRALADSQQLMVWWGQSGACKATVWEMDPRPGGKWRFEAAEPTGKIAVNNISHFEAHGEILEFSPPRLLVYTWIANWHIDPKRVTVVRWDLTPTTNGTLVKVTHSGLAQEATARTDYSGGWPGVLEYLRKFCQ